MKDKITVTLLCDTCGQSDFDHNDDKSWVKCNNCNREYSGGFAELQEFNQNRINSTVKDFGNKLITDIMSDFKKGLKGLK
jgi:ribosomal protein L37AE/L43A